MATQPQPPPRQATPTPTPRPTPPPPQRAAAPTPTPTPTPTPAPPRRPQQPPVQTIAEEQRERSDEIARMGVENYKASIDQRGPDDKPRPVAGVISPRPEASAPGGR
jgi:hypothetical protein